MTRVMAGHNPIGRRFRFISAEDSRPVAGAKPRPWYEIVGVVPDLGIDSNIQGTSAARIYGATLPKDMRVRFMSPFMSAAIRNALRRASESWRWRSIRRCG